jgi:hypothetical protein
MKDETSPGGTVLSYAHEKREFDLSFKKHFSNSREQKHIFQNKKAFKKSNSQTLFQWGNF